MFIKLTADGNQQRDVPIKNVLINLKHLISVWMDYEVGTEDAYAKQQTYLFLKNHENCIIVKESVLEIYKKINNLNNKTL